MSTKKPAKSTQAKTTAELKDIAPRKDAKGGGKAGTPTRDPATGGSAANARTRDSISGGDLGSGR